MGVLHIIWAISAIFVIGLTENTAHAFVKPAVKSRNLEVSELLSQLASTDISAFHTSNDQIANGKSVLSSSNVVISETFLEPPTYAALKSLCSFYYTAEQDQNSNRPLSFSQKKVLENNFMEVVRHTTLFQSAIQFLQSKNIFSNDPSKIKSQLYELWFTGNGFQQYFCDLQNKSLTSSAQRKVRWLNSYSLIGRDVINHEDQSNVLESTSPEFELAVYTVCALTQPINFRGVSGQVVHKNCVFDRLNSQVKAVVTVELGDGSWQQIVSVHLEAMPAVIAAPEGYLEQRHHHHNSTHKPLHKKNETADPELQKLVDALWEADSEDRVSNSSITFNWGNKVDGEKDVSPDPLFNNVNEAFLERPVYKALLSIYNHSLFHPPVCTVEESMDHERRAALDTFLTTVTNTTVFKLAYEYLKGKTGDDYASFHTTLFNLWFGTYSRCDGAKGSSGWEHVFSGEFRDTIIEGQHYWVRFYLLEKAGYINYHGYYAYDANLLGTIQYKWNDYIKRIGGFLLRSSPDVHITRTKNVSEIVQYNFGIPLLKANCHATLSSSFSPESKQS